MPSCNHTRSYGRESIKIGRLVMALTQLIHCASMQQDRNQDLNDISRSLRGRMLLSINEDLNDISRSQRGRMLLSINEDLNDISRSQRGCMLLSLNGRWLIGWRSIKSRRKTNGDGLIAIRPKLTAAMIDDQDRGTRCLP
eukprot:scaffold25962_cov83-Skeletonema_dohrnii-CCMP3373.AAC.1